MPFERVIAVDPGLVTGLVNVMFDEDGQLHGFEAYQLDHMGVGHYFSALDKRTESEIQPTVIVERFTITAATAKNSQAPYSLETIGIVRYFSNKAGIKPVFIMPAQHKSLVKPEMLKRAGMYSPGMEHANDAASLVMYYNLVELHNMTEFLKGANT